MRDRWKIDLNSVSSHDFALAAVAVFMLNVPLSFILLSQRLYIAAVVCSMTGLLVIWGILLYLEWRDHV
jgi:hypothetical protein